MKIGGRAVYLMREGKEVVLCIGHGPERDKDNLDWNAVALRVDNKGKIRMERCEGVCDNGIATDAEGRVKP